MPLVFPPSMPGVRLWYVCPEPSITRYSSRRRCRHSPVSFFPLFGWRRDYPGTSPRFWRCKSDVGAERPRRPAIHGDFDGVRDLYNVGEVIDATLLDLAALVRVSNSLQHSLDMPVERLAPVLEPLIVPGKKG